jgi:hypothetical protein
MAEVTPSGTGGEFQLSGPARDGTLVISGGIGGISFQLEELASGAEKLEDLAAKLGGIEVEVRHAWEDLCPYQNEPRATGTAALLSVGEAQDGVRAVRSELQRISGLVLDCKREYEKAEAFARTMHSLGVQSPRQELEQHADFWRTGFLNGKAAEIFAGTSASAIAPVKSFLEGHIPALRSHPPTVHRKENIPIDLDSSPAGLLDRIRLIEERGNGYIEVVEVDNDGRKAYVVVIPGTQMEDAKSGTNPFDLGGIVEGLGSKSSGVNASILEALQAAGAEKGSPVVAVGYSQGGIHAMNLAADPSFRSEYDMKYVVTAGSPVALLPPPDDVSTLHLEHRTDWVPGSEGSPNRDARNQVTVTMTNDLYVQTGEDVGLGPGHSLRGYQEGARLVGASQDPSLVQSTAVLGSVLGAGGAATATRFHLSRPKAPEVQLDRRDPMNPRQQPGAK